MYDAWGAHHAYLLDHDLGQAEAQRTAWPSVRTFANLLSRSGLAATRQRRKPTGRPNPNLTPAVDANDVWAMDFKGYFRCADGTRCDPFTLQDQAASCCAVRRWTSWTR